MSDSLLFINLQNIATTNYILGRVWDGRDIIWFLKKHAMRQQLMYLMGL